MKSHKVVRGLLALMLVLSAMAALAGTGAQAANAAVASLTGTGGKTTSGSVTTRQISNTGSSSFAGTQYGGDPIADPEFAIEGPDGPSGAAAPAQNAGAANRSLSGPLMGQAPAAKSAGQTKSNPQLDLSFNGLNFHDQRFANGGNQFSVEPPDQGLCAGNGYVLESVNDVLNVYNTAGQALITAVDLNTFYGYPAAINRTTGIRGPQVTDPSCYFDNGTQRWFQIVLTLEVNPTGGAFLGPNHLDIAVSQTANPTGAWNIYRLPVQDDGTAGTPNHQCAGGACIGDYPHIGADANGFYITTNEYPFFANGYHGAQIYAFSKDALAAGAPVVTVVQFDTAGAVGGNPGFTLWPATSPGNAFAGDQRGTEYFLSSNAAEEANGTGTSHQIIVWAVSNTRSLDSASPAPVLSNAVVTVNPYSVPPRADQKVGANIPQMQCLNDPTCAPLLLGHPDPFVEVESKLDSNDSRMQQVVYANGKLWGALDTAVSVNSATKAGIAYYILNPSVSAHGVFANLVNQGYLALANNNLTYPALAVTQSGRGVMAFTVAGQDYFPSAGYAGIDAQAGAGAVNIAAAGLGPQDGFTGYKGQVGNPPRPRWGDYGAAVVVGQSVWIASEYIGQTCTLAQYLTAPIGQCGGTRGALGNWGTRISKVTP